MNENGVTFQLTGRPRLFLRRVFPVSHLMTMLLTNYSEQPRENTREET